MAISLPSIFDCHVHFRIPGQGYKEDWKTGEAAALAGGVTGVVDMPSNLPGIVDSATMELKRRDVALFNPRIQYKLPLGVSDASIDQTLKSQMGVPAIKVFLEPHATGLGVTNPATLENLYKKTAVLLLIHAELDGHSREGAIKAVKMVLDMVRKYHKPTYFCHISTTEELGLIKQAKHEGLPVYAEVTLHHLWLDESNTQHLGKRAQMNPPLRTEADRMALWQGIREGIVDTIATDHAPHTVEEKDSEKGAAGFPSIELFLPLLFTGVAKGYCTVEDIIRCTSANPSKLFGFHIKSHSVEVDETAEWEVTAEAIRSKANWSPYLGMNLTGKVMNVVL